MKSTQAFPLHDYQRMASDNISNPFEDLLIPRWYLILDGLTLVASVIGTFVSIAFLVTVAVCHRKCFSKNNFISCNTLLAICLLSGVTLYSVTTVLITDLHHTKAFDTLCIWRSYFVYTEIAMLYYSFVTQSYYRYMRVIYANRSRYSSIATLCIIMVVQWIVIHAVMLYLPLANQIEFNIGSHMCTVPMTRYVLIWTMCAFVYMPAYNMITFVYIRLVLFINTSRRRVVSSDIRKARRELSVIKRMGIVLFIFSVSGIPYSTYALLAIVDKDIISVHYYRIITFFNTLALAVASCIILVQSNNVRHTIVSFLFMRDPRRVHPVPYIHT